MLLKDWPPLLLSVASLKSVAGNRHSLINFKPAAELTSSEHLAGSSPLFCAASMQTFIRRKFCDERCVCGN